MDMISAMRETIEVCKKNGMHQTTVELRPGCDFNHFEYMLKSVQLGKNPQGGDGFSEGKLGRWLGWIQGAAAAAGYITLEECKEINKRWSDNVTTPDQYWGA